MDHLNIEIKAKSNNHNKIREILKSKDADFKGIDHQIDTYFNVRKGRLKLREGKIENSLIYYDREDKKGPKQSNVSLFKTPPKSSLKNLLSKALGVLVVVNKKREIYFIDNIKFHIDSVKDLGNFIEIEAIDEDESIGKAKLLKQCQFFLDLFKISQGDLISSSYSDLLLKKK
jgi:adenylate cyclase, class 2